MDTTSFRERARINIDQYFNQQDSVIVVNRTEPLGIVSIALGEKGDMSYTLLKTSDPVVITDYVPKKHVVESANFRSMVQRGIIELMTLDEYEKWLDANPGRVEQIRKEMNILTSRATISDETPASLEETSEAVDESNANISPRIIQLMHGLAAGDERSPSEESVIQELQSMNMSQEEKAYVLTHAVGKVKNWIVGIIYGEAAESKEDGEVKKKKIKKIKKVRRS